MLSGLSSFRGSSEIANLAFCFVDVRLRVFFSFIHDRTDLFARSHDVAELGAFFMFHLGASAVEAFLGGISDIFDGAFDFVCHTFRLPQPGNALNVAASR